MGKFKQAIDTAMSGAGPSAVCSIRQISQKLDPADRAELHEVLADPSVMHVAISRVLTDMGYKVIPSTVRRHRNGECRCRQGL